MNDRAKVIIWGAGERGAATYNLLLEDDRVEIIGFGDNDTNKTGGVYFDLRIYNLDTIKELQDEIDCVLIAIDSGQEVFCQLKKELRIAVCRDYKAFCKEVLYMRCSIDISGWCNARCKYCYTGRRNISGISYKKEYMEYDGFVRIHNHLIDAKVIHHFNEIMLYSWGDPLLNNDYLNIISYLSSQNQVFSISTNASSLKLTDCKDAYKTCSTVIFSLSGVRPESYKKIHGFDLSIIKNNIKTIIENMREHGFSGEGKLSFHVYRFNETELTEAKAFADSLNLKFEPIRAYLASWSLQKDYLSGGLDPELLNDIKKEIYTDNVEQLISERPGGYRCPLENILSLDRNGTIELCCCCDAGAKEFYWNNIIEIKSLSDWIDYRSRMLECETCVECRKRGIDYWICNGEKLSTDIIN